MELEDLGCGFPLYFYFKIFMGIIYVVMVLAITIVGSILYYREDKGHEWDESDSAPFIVKISLGNMGRDEEQYKRVEVNVMVLLNSLVILAIYIMNMVFRTFQVRVIKKVDEINVTPGDFTVMVSNLPRDKSKEEIKQWILEHKNGNICEINLCYDIKVAVDKLRKINKLKAILVNFDRYKNKHSRSEIEERISNLERDIEVMRDMMNNHKADKSFTGKAFVIFDKQSDAEELIWKFKRSWIRRVFNYITLKVCSVSKFRFEVLIHSVVLSPLIDTQA